MPGTIAIDASLQVTYGPFSFPWAGSIVLSQANRGMAASLHYLTTMPEAINVGEVGSPGVVVLHNLGDAGMDSIYYGVNDAGTMKTLGVLAAGEFAIFRLASGVGLMARAANTTAILQPYIFEG